MATLIDSRTETPDNRMPGEHGARLAFENAHRLRKKALISDIQQGLGLGGRDAAPVPVPVAA